MELGDTPPERLHQTYNIIESLTSSRGKSAAFLMCSISFCTYETIYEHIDLHLSQRKWHRKYLKITNN